MKSDITPLWLFFAVVGVYNENDIWFAHYAI